MKTQSLGSGWQEEALKESNPCVMIANGMGTSLKAGLPKQGDFALVEISFLS